MPFNLFKRNNVWQLVDQTIQETALFYGSYSSMFYKIPLLIQFAHTWYMPFAWANVPLRSLYSGTLPVRLNLF